MRSWSGIVCAKGAFCEECPGVHAQVPHLVQDHLLVKTQEDELVVGIAWHADECLDAPNLVVEESLGERKEIVGGSHGFVTRMVAGNAT